VLVLGTDAADVVSSIGGLVFDTVRAGLQVEVYTETAPDDRPLRILGVAARPLPDDFEFESEWPDVIFFAAELHLRHASVRRLITHAARRHRAQIAVWGDSASSKLSADLATALQHPLSAAAQAFKRHAFTAAGVAAAVSPTESFRVGQHRPEDGAAPLLLDQPFWS
jgi:hypothetical protein